MKSVISFLTMLICLAWFVATAGANADDTLPPDCKVLHVYRTGKHTNFDYAHKGQSITVIVTNLESFFSCNVVSNDLRIKGIKADADNLVPFINHIPLIGCTMLFDTTGDDNTHELIFKLDRDATNTSSKDHWNQLFSSLPFFESQRVDVSVGIADGWVMQSDVGLEKDQDHFSFVVVPLDGSSIAGLVVIAAMLLALLALASATDILRDPYGPLRPDGRAAFSLARTQMAFWSFLVLASYFLLWRMTGDKDTITQSVLILMGISAGTALGSAMVDVGKTEDGGRSQYFLPLNAEGKSRQEKQQARRNMVDALLKTKEDLQTKLTNKLKDFQNLAATALVDRDNNLKEQMATEEQIRRTNVQLEFYKRGVLWRFVTDILGDNGAISFHRFQIAAWTIVLGIIFLEEVVTQIAMPEFNSTLLGLMGISAGTYIGFKIPEAKN